MPPTGRPVHGKQALPLDRRACSGFSIPWILTVCRLSSVILATDETWTMISIKRISLLLFTAANCFLVETVVAQCPPDDEPPTITCPAPKTVFAVKNGSTCGFTSFPVEFPTVSDNCPGVSGAVKTSGNVLVFGNNFVVFQVTDASGKTASCTWTVFVDSSACGDLNTVTLNCGYFQDIPIIGWLLSLFFGWIICIFAKLFGLA